LRPAPSAVLLKELTSQVGVVQEDLGGIHNEVQTQWITVVTARTGIEEERWRGNGQGMCPGYALELTMLLKLLSERFLVNIRGLF